MSNKFQGLNRISIIICTERGELEKMSMLLVASIRKFGGSLKKVPIYSYQPRKGLGVNERTKKFFLKNDVTLISEILNIDHHDYPLANKIYASSHAERNIESEILVFLDSDIFFLDEPSEFLIPTGYDAVLRPVDSKNVGAENEEDPNWEYWRELYGITGVRDHSYINTSVDRKRILLYWNSGHMVVRKEKGVFQQWEENFHKVMRLGLRPGDGLFYVEQSVFAATVSALECRIKTFSPYYNYPIHLQQRIPDTDEKANSVHDIVSAHYHKIFRDGFARDILGPMIDTGHPKDRWLVRNLHKFGLIDKNEIQMSRRKLVKLPGYLKNILKNSRK